MDSSGTERRDGARETLSDRVGAAFQLLMQVRMLVAAITLLLIPRDGLVPQAFVLVTCIVLLSWLAANHWRLLVPWLLRHPILLALDICVSFAVLGIGGTSGPFFLSTVITAAVAGLLYRWPGVVGVSVIQIILYYGTLAFSLQNEAVVLDTFQSVIGQPVFYPLAGFAGAALRRLFDEQARIEDAHRQAEVVAAAAEERARLAREMHDSLAKTLRGISLAAATLPVWIRNEPARGMAEAERIAAAAEIASREARNLLDELRSESIMQSLREAVEETVRQWSADADVQVALELDERADLPPMARYEAVAILSETLTNVARHAEARQVLVRLAAEGADVVVTVRDDGKGFEVKELPVLARDGHYGMVGLHERAARVGGTVTVLSEPGGGTTVTTRLPRTTPADQRLAEVS
ncbi:MULTISPECIES: ATP-binding protein [unclassified Actinomadura]|uniref:sensor histidine kinase n=1 Tax=unclassified Actinomadura TaxID=2626254 RepID=UPI0011F05882|nr:ATP-binding protein [Actinomadura sp. K4S16]